MKLKELIVMGYRSSFTFRSCLTPQRAASAPKVNMKVVIPALIKDALFSFPLSLSVELVVVPESVAVMMSYLAVTPMESLVPLMSTRAVALSLG